MIDEYVSRGFREFGITTRLYEVVKDRDTQQWLWSLKACPQCGVPLPYTG